MFRKPWVKCISFDVIKIQQIHWCSRNHMEYIVTFSFFCEFDWKFPDLIYIFYKAKCEHMKNQTYFRGLAQLSPLNQYQSCNLSKPDSRMHYFQFLLRYYLGITTKLFLEFHKFTGIISSLKCSFDKDNGVWLY